MIGNVYKGSSFKGLLAYLFHGRADDPNPHRVEWHETRNLPIDDPDALPRILRATASLSASVKQPVYHVPISWPPEERLDRKTQLAIADRLLADLGLSEHECVIVSHNDGDCSHIHLVINRVHPETGKVWNAWRDVYRIMESLERQEREHGLRLVPRPDLEEYRQGRKDPDRKREASREERLRAEREGDAPLAPWTEKEMRDVRTAVTKHFRDAGSWADLEERLRRHGLELRRTGQGFRITDGKRFMTLSKVGKHARWEILEERFARTWEEHAATRALNKGEQERLEPPSARDIMRGKRAAQVERGAKLIEAWRAHRAYEQFCSEERRAADEGRKLMRLSRRLRANEAIGLRVNEQLDLARDGYARLMRGIYRNPVQAAANLKDRLRADKDWPDIDFGKIGRFRGLAALGRKTTARKSAEKQVRSIRRSFMRVWRLEAQLETLTHEWQTLQAKIAQQEGVYERQRSAIGAHADRQMTRDELAALRATALANVEPREIYESDLHQDSKKALFAVIAAERGGGLRTERGRSRRDRGRDR